MPKHNTPRRGSMQFWPRKKARKILHSVNWKALKDRKEKSGILGIVAYKVGMASSIVRDNTEGSLTKGKKIAIPTTILECPSMKILSVRFYNRGKPVSEILISQDKELKRKIKLPKGKDKQEIEKELMKKIEGLKEYDDVRIIVHTLVNQTSIKKTPDIIELALGGSRDEKVELVKKLLNKEIHPTEIIPTWDQLVDLRGITKGKGFQGPVKRFGIKLRFHKSEKGQRKVGSIGPWHPARVMYTVPMAGQMGFFSRISYNGRIIGFGKISEKDINISGGFKHFGKIKTNYILIKGSVPGSRKRPLLLTPPLRPTKKQIKKNYEFLELK